MLNVKKNALKWAETTSISMIDLEDETTDFDDSVDEDVKDVLYKNSPLNFSILKQLHILHKSDLSLFIKDVQLELLSPPPQLS